MNKELQLAFRDNLERYLDEFKKLCLSKYDMGSIEHGDWPSEERLESEIMKEVADMVNYKLMINFMKQNNA